MPLIENPLNLRLDLWLTQELEWASRTEIQKWINDGRIRLNGQRVRASVIPQTGNIFDFDAFIPLVWPKEICPTLIDEHPDFLVLNKPAGLACHKGLGDPFYHLLAWLEHHLPQDLKNENNNFQLVHRLDKHTSGVIVVARTDNGKKFLEPQFSQGKPLREYEGIVTGNPKFGQLTVTTPIRRNPENSLILETHPDGKPAITHMRFLKTVHQNQNTLLHFRLETGRTHQIRLHTKEIGHPLLGDARYGQPDPQYAGHLLHARLLGFSTPEGEKWYEAARIWND